MNFENLNSLGNFNNFTSIDDLQKFLNVVSQFESYESFFEFMKILKSIPTIEQIDELVKSNTNLCFFEFLKTNGYFKLLDPIQKYHLFVTACSYNSIDIAMLILNCPDIDLEGVKELMLNYLVKVGTNVEYIIFRKIWEKNIIHFNQEKIEEIFFSIFKTLNLKFIEWFCSLNQIDLKNQRIKNKISNEILSNAVSKSDFEICKFICSIYLDLYNDETTMIHKKIK
jgi:hypothetical protein